MAITLGITAIIIAVFSLQYWLHDMNERAEANLDRHFRHHQEHGDQYGTLYACQQCHHDFAHKTAAAVEECLQCFGTENLILRAEAITADTAR